MSSAEDPAAAAALAAFERGQQQWRERRASDLVREGGWTTLVGLHWIDPGAHYAGSDADNGIRLAAGPDHLGMFELRNGVLRLVPDPAAELTADGEALRASTVLRDDAAPAGPTVLAFDQGRGVATVIRRGERLALRVKHSDAATRTGFRGLDYWPATQDWRKTGRFIAHAPGRTIRIASIIGTTDEVANPGLIEFEHESGVHRLEALDQGDGTLFVVFADATNGQGSYGAGRFLDAPTADSEGRVVLDFNRAYNPPCAFTPFATCPLPPVENRLAMAVQAGEKAYRTQP
ncbi:MAG: DUF1684 domain-containing protein [Pseudomonadota bacterium]|nr:DUF1684 domain-containing protein [Pseudomonadota bacterium]